MMTGRLALTRTAALCVALGGCALTAEDPTTTAQRPAALVDAYLIAHGMARNYAARPEADPAVVGELVRLDRRAADAVRRLAGQPGADLSATASAVAALTDYAARQTDAVSRP